jgi:hypothetical protein
MDVKYDPMLSGRNVGKEYLKRGTREEYFGVGEWGVEKA